jgi:hypothetical protein
VVDHWGAPLYGDPCRGCGFTWAGGQAGSISLMRSLPDSIDELVIGATGTERLPDLGWNISGYIAHMTDNTQIWAERLIGVARGADPHVVPYDPDLLAESRHYNGYDREVIRRVSFVRIAQQVGPSLDEIRNA